MNDWPVGNCLVLLVLVFLVFAQTVVAGNCPPEPPSDLLVDFLSEPLGIESANPQFSWVVNDADANERQTAYQILVATSETLLDEDKGDVWDSGKVASSASSNVVYGGKELAPRSAYYWKVRTWDKDEEMGPYSKPQMFVTAMKDEWQGIPIWADESDPRESLKKHWSDYTIELEFMIVENAAGVWFRALDQNNNYMWQVGNLHGNPPVPGEPILKTHVCTNGKYEVLKEIPLEGIIPIEQFKNTFHRMKIEVQQDEIRTYINDQLVDVTVDQTHAFGLIGFRNGGTEESRIKNLHVYNDSKTLAKEDFADPQVNRFTGGTIGDGQLVMGKGARALYRAEETKQESEFVFLRKSFDLPDSPIDKAFVYVTAQSPEEAKQYVYRLYVNGSFVGVGPVRDYRGLNRYNVFEVTDLLNSGRENVIASLNYAKKDKRFLCQMEILYTDGTRQTICSDGSWRVLEGSDIFLNAGNIGGTYDARREYIDAREYPFGWNNVGFNDTTWDLACARAMIPGLVASSTRNIRMETIEPVQVVKKGDNHYFVDFGKAVIGGLQLTVEGVAGQNVEIRLGEELTAPHTVMYQLRTGNMYQETWTLKDGPQTIEHWGMRVFRYAEVVNAAVETGSIKALVLSYPFDEEAAEFECSNSVLNDVWDLCKYSIKATSLDLYVDTFTRERLPYEGDAYINQLSHYCVDREFALPRYSIEYLYYRPTWPTEYKQLSVLMAWEDYMYTGNKESLEQNYAVLTTKPLDWCINADGLVEKPIKDDLIDWPNSQRDGYVFTDVNTVINSINYKALRDMASIASVLQQQDDYAYYTSLADTLQDAMNEHLYDPVVGAYRDGRGVDHWATHASAFPLAFGVPTSQQAPRVAQYLAQRGMRVGVYGSQFLLQALYNGGEDQAALDLMSARTGNSWGHMIYDLGATIVTEAWDPAQKPNMSFSHAWASAPANTIVRGMFGILPLEPGFSVFQIKPQLGDLEWAKLQVPTIKGTIKVEVESTNKLFEMKVTIPTNTVATVFVPMQKGSILEYDQMVLAAEIAGGYAIIERVGSGIHTFTVRK